MRGLIKNLGGYKTVIFGFLVFLLGLLEYLSATPFLQQYWPQALQTIGVIIVALRAITSGPIFRRQRYD